VAMVVEQDWRPRDLPPLDKLFDGDEPVTLFLPDMKQEDAWEFLPWDNTADVTVDFGHGQRLLMPGRY